MSDTPQQTFIFHAQLWLKENKGNMEGGVVERKTVSDQTAMKL